MLPHPGGLKRKQLKLESVRGSNTNNDNSVGDPTNNVGGDVVMTAVNNSTGSLENDEASTSSMSNLIAGENPLQNPVILQHLFQLCPASILTSCRLVCKQWYDESLLTWRTAFPIAITLTYKNEILLDKGFFFGRSSLERIRTPLKDLLEYVSEPENQCETKPYRNFQIYSCISIFWIEDFSQFWISIGSNLTTLKLFNCTFRTVEEFRDVIYKYCPILEKLQILLCTFRTRDPENGLECKEPIYGERLHLKSLYVKLGSPDNEINQFPVSWIELFSRFHSLTSFGLECSDKLPESECSSMFESLMAAIRIIRKQDKRKLPLKGFQFLSKLKISHEQFSVMKELRLPLKECSIMVHCEMDVDFWRRLLEYNAPSMNTITVYSRGMVKDALKEPPLFRQFPFGIELPNVTKLESRGDLIKSYNFLKYMPNLSELEISLEWNRFATNSVSNSSKEELANVEMRRLMTFKLSYFVSDEDVQQLSKWMPNINNLEIALSDGQFSIVCQSWKNLRKLTVFMDEPQTSEGNGKEIEIRQYIENLKCLESLFLPHIKFSPETFFHVFLQLPSLRIVKDADGPVERCQLNIFSYRQAVEDNAVEQWIAVNGQDLEKRRSN